MNNAVNLQRFLIDILGCNEEDLVHLELDNYCDGIIEINEIIENAVHLLISKCDYLEFNTRCLNLSNDSPFLRVVNPLNSNQSYLSLDHAFNSSLLEHHTIFYTIIKCYWKTLTLNNKYPDEWINAMKRHCHTFSISFANFNNESIVLPYYFHNLIPDEWFVNSINNLKINEDGDKEMFDLLMTNLSNVIGQSHLLSNHLMTLLTKYIHLISHDEVRLLVQNLSNWIPDISNDTDGNVFQKTCHLGPILGITPFYNDVGMHKDLQQSINYNKSAIVSCLLDLWKKQKEIVKIFLNINTRENTYRFLNKCFNVNMKRGGIQIDMDKVSGHGFMVNLNAVLQQLVEQVNLTRVDIDYLSREASSDNIDSFGRMLSQETRIAVDQNGLLNFSRKLVNENVKYQPDFHTRCFYWSMMSHNLSVISVWNQYREEKKNLKYMTQQKEEINQYLTNNTGNSRNYSMAKDTLEKVEREIEKCRLKAESYENVLFDESFMMSLMKFYEMVSRYVIKNSESVESFRYLPQFVFENISVILNMVVKSEKNLIQELDKYKYEKIIELVIYVINNPSYFQSPYLVSKFVKVFTVIFHNINNNEMPNCKLKFDRNILIDDNLINNLIKYFNFVEKTGAHSEFYEKFAIRYDISYLLKMLWRDRPPINFHFDNDAMIRFINLMSNDITYLLDDAFDNIRNLKRAQQKYRDVHNLSNIDQSAMMQEFSQFEGIISSDLQLVELFGKLLITLTTHCPTLFMSEEIVHKFTAMLNHFISDMLGSKRVELIIKDKSKCNWDARRYLDIFISLYCNVQCETFFDAISKEERYFSQQNIEDIIKCIKEKLINSLNFSTFISIVESSMDIRKRREIEENDWDDVPFEYLDPIMSTIMSDPVLIPQSNIIVDKSVIKRHLLNDTCDPFNRQPLKLEDLIPQPGLKAEIFNWIAKKRLRQI